MTTDLTAHEAFATPAPYADPLADRMRAQMDLIKAQIMPPLVDAQGKVTGPATDDETALAIAQAAARGVDLLANQGRLVRNKQGVVELWRTWEGLVVVAQRTGEYGGIEATLYTDGRKQAAQNRWGKIVEQYVWQDAWDSDEPPVACTVGIWRKGADRPSWGIAHYSTWGTEPDPEGWSDKIVNGRKVMNRWNKPVRIHNGVRVPKASEWWKMPKAIHQLAIAALRNALKAEFQPDTLRKATMAAAKGMTRDERLEAASEIVGRDVDTFNDLDPSEYAEVYDEFVGRSDYDTTREDTEAAPDSGPAAGPLAPEHHGPAPTHEAQSSAGRTDVSTGPIGSAVTTSTPAEHHSGEELGEVPSPEGAEPGGGASDMTGTPPSGPASETTAGGPQPWSDALNRYVEADRASAPTRQRRTAKPGKPNLKEAALQATAERHQTTVERGPTRWRQTIPQPHIAQLIGMFHGKVNDLEEFLHTFAEQDPSVPPLTDWTPDTHWTDTQLAALMETARAETTLSR